MLDKLRFWCNKVIPLVYDEALSYYEVLCKVAHKINELVESTNTLFSTTVFKVNDVEPVDGNVTLTPGDFEGIVGSVNGVTPVDGNVTLSGSDISGVVRTVNGFVPDGNGNATAGTVRSVNGKSPTSLPTPGSITLTATDVGALPNSIDPVETVNGISPDSSGNVNVGTVKSVNNTQPDSNGNVNLATVAGVTSVCGVGADGEGNVALDAGDVGAVATVDSIAPDATDNIQLGLNGSVNVYVNATTGNDSNDGTSEHPFATINKALTYGKKFHYDGVGGVYIINIAAGNYNEYLDTRRYPTRLQFVLGGDIKIGGFAAYGNFVEWSLAAHKLTVEYNSGLTYWGSGLFILAPGSHAAFSWNGSMEFIDTGSGKKGIDMYQSNPCEIPAVTFTGANYNNGLCIQLSQGSILSIPIIVAPSTKLGTLAYGSVLRCNTINGNHSYDGTSVGADCRIEVASTSGNVTFNSTTVDTDYSDQNPSYWVENGICYCMIRFKAKIYIGNNDVIATGLPKRNNGNPAYMYAITTGEGVKCARVRVKNDGTLETFYAGNFSANDTVCVIGCYPTNES